MGTSSYGTDQRRAKPNTSESETFAHSLGQGTTVKEEHKIEEKPLSSSRWQVPGAAIEDGIWSLGHWWPCVWQCPPFRFIDRHLLSACWVRGGTGPEAALRQLSKETTSQGGGQVTAPLSGAKGFFRRTIRMKLEYEKCDQSCKIQKNRNKCQYCRFASKNAWPWACRTMRKKERRPVQATLHVPCWAGAEAQTSSAEPVFPCHAVSPPSQVARSIDQGGPSIRFGRMPEAEKRKLVAGLTAREEQQHSPQLADLRAFSKHIYNAYLKNFNMTKKKARSILTGKSSHTAVSALPGSRLGSPDSTAQAGVWEHGLGPQAWPLMGPGFQPFVIHDIETLWQAEKGPVWKQLVNGLPPYKESRVHVFSRCPYTTVETVRELTEFAKSIPNFSSLFLNDQVTLLKYGVHEAIFAMLASVVNKDGLLVANGSGFVSHEFLRSLRKPFSDILEPKFEFAVKFDALELEDGDLALFIAAIILCGGERDQGRDRPGLVNVPQVEAIQDTILRTLEFHLQVNHPDSQYLFPKLLQKMADVWQLVTEHAQMMQRIKKTETETLLPPLLQEISGPLLPTLAATESFLKTKKFKASTNTPRNDCAS
ncbi:Peroxisome proliferator-activated receptor delta [Heterocephalus glaber]|uniref:Peroxisome proliferator-activated receptor delta n=1 Tax=Heterocephalus glaber TaxID=10181 RepID=G5BDB4_HETGA|nr:Peroxisome proliferator-activated receptor delta [Heterocephalus glaber]